MSVQHLVNVLLFFFLYEHDNCTVSRQLKHESGQAHWSILLHEVISDDFLLICSFTFPLN